MKVYFKLSMIIVSLLLLLALKEQGSQAFYVAGIWYVAPDGINSNDCLTPITPCATINGTLNKPDFIPGDTILVAIGIYTDIGDEVLLLDKDAILSGGWDTTFTTQSEVSTIDAENSRRGMTVMTGVTVVAERFTFQNGAITTVLWGGGGIQNSGTLSLTLSTITNNTTIGSSYGGGGLYNDSGAIMVLSNCTISHNMTNADGGGIHNNGGTITLNNTTIDSNTSSRDGGGIFNATGFITLSNSMITTNETTFGGGGGIYNDDSVNLDYTIVSNNIANNGGGIYSVNGTVTLNNSLVANNRAKADSPPGGSGGGIYNHFSTLILNSSTINNNVGEPFDDNSITFGGGIYTGGPLALSNSTVSENIASQGGGIFRWSGITELNNSTISDNIATWPLEGGGGIYNGPYDTITLQNSILAKNIANIGSDCSGNDINSSGYNIIGNATDCTFMYTTGDLVNIDPILFSLFGSPGYHPLLLGSPAINAGNPAGCTDHLGNLLSTDQRGIARVGRCDIGAYEFDPNHNPLMETFLPVIAQLPCPVLYQDDFGNTASGWPIADTGNVLFEYRNDEYRILLRNSDWRGGATPDFPATNYIVAVDVRNATGVFGSYGLSFGISNDFSQYYVFEIYPDGIYAIWNYDTGNWTLLAEGQSGSINLGTASNRLKVERNGATIAAYANGQLLTTVSDNSFIGSREMGLIAFSYDQPGVDIRFDNFVVYPTDYPSSCGTPSALAATNSMGNRQSLDGALSDGGVTRPNQAGR